MPNMGMFIIGDKIPFNTKTVEEAPALAALYELWVGEELIYIGMSEGGENSNLRKRLYRHLMGVEGPCTQEATHFMYDVSDIAAGLEDAQIDIYETQFGKKPRCNDRDPDAST